LFSHYFRFPIRFLTPFQPILLLGGDGVASALSGAKQLQQSYRQSGQGNVLVIAGHGGEEGSIEIGTNKRNWTLLDTEWGGLEFASVLEEAGYDPYQYD